MKASMDSNWEEDVYIPVPWSSSSDLVSSDSDAVFSSMLILRGEYSLNQVGIMEIPIR
jgi:hypothetical protein